MREGAQGGRAVSSKQHCCELVYEAGVRFENEDSILSASIYSG